MHKQDQPSTHEPTVRKLIVIATGAADATYETVQRFTTNFHRASAGTKNLANWCKHWNAGLYGGY